MLSIRTLATAATRARRARRPAAAAKAAGIRVRTMVKGVRGFYDVGSSLKSDDLDFSHSETKSHIRYNWKNGAWDAGELVDSPYVKVHVNSNVLHYGQALFEGLKAFHGKDGKVRVLNPYANSARLNHGCRRLRMPEVPEELFLESLDRVIADNVGHIPPYGRQQTLYLRPNLFGHGAQIGLAPAPEYSLIVTVHPVGNYFKHGPKPARATIVTDFDRAASRGLGDVKAAGNYAADMLPASIYHGQGYSMGLYLDAAQQHVEEFGTSNFVGIAQDGSYVTPDSGSILRSITNIMMQDLAKSRGINTEVRPIPIAELATLKSAGGCGTAVVFQPIKSIDYKDQQFTYEDDAHATLSELATDITRIGFAEKEDEFGWCHEVVLPP